MATRFTRLSVVADGRQLDASLPASRPVAEFLADLPRLLSLPVTSPPTQWALSAPQHGHIAPERSLDEVGVLDGDVLYLSPAAAAAESPTVDDVLTAVAATVGRDALPWRGAYRDRVVAALAGALLGTLVGVLAADRRLGAVLVALAAGMLALARPLRTRGGGWLGWLAVPAAGLGTLRLTGSAEPDLRLAAAVATALLAGTLAAVTGVRRPVWRPVWTATGTASALAAVLTGLLAAGADAAAVAAWSVPALVLAAGVLPQLAVSTSGLLGLVRRAEEAGESVRRRELTEAVRTGRATVNGVLAAVTGAAAVASLGLVSGGPAQAVLGGVLGLVFLLRSRGFVEAYQVGCMLAVPVVAVVGAALALPGWLRVGEPLPATLLRAGTVLAALLVVLGSGYARLSPVPAARLSRLYDRLDTLAILAVVPLVLVAQNVFGHLTTYR
jgi:ESX secretion system protein EccD